MKDLVLFGIQGSGKGTQAKMLASSNPKYAYFSSGDVFRALTSNENAIKDYLHARLASGDLIDDSVTNALFELYLHTVIDGKKVMLLDGYPRTILQLAMMLTAANKYNRNLQAVHFVLPDEIAIERMLARQRPDDTLEVIKRRIQQYHEVTFPILDMFKRLYPVIEIDATPDVEIIHQEVMKVIV